MTTTYYAWGMLQGGYDPATGLPAIITAAGGGVSGPPEQFTGTLVGPTTINFSDDTRGLTIRNTDDNNALEYSFDNINWFYCAAHQVIQEGVETDILYLRAVVGAPTYEVLGILTA